jgi:hypothetical protein
VPNPVASAPAARSASPSASSGVRAVSASRPPAPLTGLPAASAADAQRRAVALVLAGANPRGLTSADVVFQEFASPVRYIAVFQSKQASRVGPLTSTQPTDGQALSVLRPLFGYDGSTPVFTRVLDHTDVTDLGYATHPSLYASAPQGLTTSTRAVVRAVPGSGAPPQIFYYGSAGTGDAPLATTGLSRPASARVTIPGYGTESWVYDGHAGLWELASGGPRVNVANVVVQTVSYRQVVSHKAGTIVRSARLIGTGPVEVLSGNAAGSGTAASGTWSKPHLNDLTNYFDDSGYPMVFQPGTTWVIFAPKGTRVSTSAGQ